MADKKAPQSGGYYKYSFRSFRFLFSFFSRHLFLIFRILGIEPSADEKEIKKAYRAMALKYHPGSSAHFSNRLNGNH
jgi:DnaJ-class molecular chaperone